MRTTNEYVIEWVEGDKVAAITCPKNSGLSNRLIKLAEEHPNEVQMSHSEFFHVPKSWIKVSPPPRRTYTEEQRKAIAERLRNARG